MMGKTEPGPDLPFPLSGHAMIAINSSAFMVTGGKLPNGRLSPQTSYFFEDDHVWLPGPDLIKGRYTHTTGLVTDAVTLEQFVVVVGGFSDSGFEDTVEMLLPGSNEWNSPIQE